MVKHSGQRSLKISATDTDNSGIIDPVVVPLQVTPGQQYTLSYWVKGENVVSLTGQLMILQITSKENPSTGGPYLFTGRILGCRLPYRDVRLAKKLSRVLLSLLIKMLWALPSYSRMVRAWCGLMIL